MPVIVESLTFGSIGTDSGLHPSKPASSRSYNAYFLSLIEMPVLFLAISKAKKYFAGPRSGSLKAICSTVLKVATTKSSVLI